VSGEHGHTVVAYGSQQRDQGLRQCSTEGARGYERQTDRQTDGQVDRSNTGTRYATALVKVDKVLRCDDDRR